MFITYYRVTQFSGGTVVCFICATPPMNGKYYQTYQV